MVSAVDHVDEVLVVELAEEVNLDFEGLLLIEAWLIDLESIELVVLASQIDAG